MGASRTTLEITIRCAKELAGRLPVASSSTRMSDLGGKLMKRRFTVSDYGAVGDGQTLDTVAINRAIAVCHQSGGGTVFFPAGVYLSGSIRLRSNVTLLLPADATILGAANDIGVYDVPESNPWEQYQDFGFNHVRNSLIWGEDLENVGIRGTGTINGGGITREGKRDRVPMGGGDKAIALRSCRHVMLEGFTLRQGGHFAILATDCENLRIADLTIRTPRDGIDLVGCRAAEISGCDVEAIRYDENGVKRGGDDAIVLKSNRSLGRRLLSENIVVRDCKVATNCFGIHFGSETAGDFRNIRFSNITIEHADKAGIGLTSNDGAVIEDVIYENIVMRRVAAPIHIKVSNRQGRTPESPTPVGKIRNIRMTNITATDVRGYIRGDEWTSTIMGKPESPVENIVLENVRITGKGGGRRKDADIVPPEVDSHQVRDIGVRPAYGFYCRNVRGLQLRHVQLGFEKDDLRPALVLENASHIKLQCFRAQRASESDCDVLFRSS